MLGTLLPFLGSLMEVLSSQYWHRWGKRSELTECYPAVGLRKKSIFFYCYIIYLFFTSNLLVIYYPSPMVSNLPSHVGVIYLEGQSKKKKTYGECCSSRHGKYSCICKASYSLNALDIISFPCPPITNPHSVLLQFPLRMVLLTVLPLLEWQKPFSGARRWLFDGAVEIIMWNHHVEYFTSKLQVNYLPWFQSHVNYQ